MLNNKFKNMKRIAVLFTALIMGSTMFSQKMITRSGEIKFDATVPGAMDEVIGTNKTVSAIFDKSTSDLEVKIEKIGCSILYNQLEMCMKEKNGNISSCREEWSSFRSCYEKK